MLRQDTLEPSLGAPSGAIHGAGGSCHNNPPPPPDVAYPPPSSVLPASREPTRPKSSGEPGCPSPQSHRLDAHPSTKLWLRIHAGSGGGSVRRTVPRQGRRGASARDGSLACPAHRTSATPTDQSKPTNERAEELELRLPRLDEDRRNRTTSDRPSATD